MMRSVPITSADVIAGGPDGADHAPGLYLAAAVSPFKRLESEVMLQYQKLGLKARAGADFVIPQLGYDSRKWDELLRWMRLHDLRLPVLANVYVLTRTVTRLFNANEIPGCVVSDELLALIEKAAAGPDEDVVAEVGLALKDIGLDHGHRPLEVLIAVGGLALEPDLALLNQRIQCRGRAGQPFVVRAKITVVQVMEAAVVARPDPDQAAPRATCVTLNAAPSDGLTCSYLPLPTLRNISGGSVFHLFALLAAVSWGLYSNLSRRFAGEEEEGAVPISSDVIEFIARLASETLRLNPKLKPMQPALLDKHFLRKHGRGAYYGQG